MSTPIRVLMVTSEWPSADLPFAAPYLVQQVDFLKRAGADVHVLAFRGSRKLLNYLMAWRRVRRTLRRQPFDVIHAQFGQAALLAWPRRLPLVVTFHGSDLHGVVDDDGRPTLGGRVLQRLCRSIARHADAVIVVSERLRRLLPAAVPAQVIPMGLDFERIPHVPRQLARRQLGLPQEPQLVLFVGNPAEPVKRYSLACRAVDVLSVTRPAELILGFQRPRSEILLMMNACDALLMTSLHEGSPCVVKEALACGLPVVSLNVGDVEERLRGVEGCEICEDDRPSAIAASLDRVLSRGERIHGRDAVRHLDERLLADRVLTIYRSVVAARGHSGIAVHPHPTVGRH